MKLSSRDAARYCAKPDPRHCGILIYGEDAMRVALKRQQAIAALVGPNADEEMRLTRLAASELRSDPAVLADATKARGFFPGHRVVFVEDATDAVAAAITSAIDQWEPDDAQIVVTGKQLAPRSSLRKLFEGRNNTVAIGIYDDPPTREEIEATLHEAGVAADGKALQELLFLATTLDPGDFRQTVE